MRSLVPVTKQNAGVKPYNCGRCGDQCIIWMWSRAWVRHFCRLGTSWFALQATSPDLITYNTAIAACFGAPPHVASDAWFISVNLPLQSNRILTLLEIICQEFATQTQKYRRIHWLTNPFLHLLARAFLLRNRWDQWEGALEEHRDANEMQSHQSLYPAAPYHEDVATERRNSTKHLQTSVFQRLDPTDWPGKLRQSGVLAVAPAWLGKTSKHAAESARGCLGDRKLIWVVRPTGITNAWVV